MAEYFTESAETAMPKPTGTADEIQQLADDLDSLGHQLASTQIFTEGRPLDDWFGEAASTYANEVSGLRDIIQNAVDIHADMKTSLETYQSAFKTFVDTTLPGHHADWDTLKSEAASAIADVNSEWNEAKRKEAAGEVCVDHGSFEREIDRIKSETRQAQIDLLGDFVSDSNTLAGEAATAKGTIAAALDSFIPPEVVGQAGSGDVGTYLFDSLPFLESQAYMEDGLFDGERAADFLSDPANYNEYGYLTDEALKFYMDEFGGRGADDPFFAHKLVDEIGSEKILSMAALWSGAAYSPTMEYPERMQDFLEDMGAATMITTGSTRDPSTSDAWGAWDLQADNLTIGGVTGQDALVQERLDDLATAMSQRYKDDGTVAVEDWEGLGGHMYLGQLLGAAGEQHGDLAVSDAFLNQSATVTNPDGSTSTMRSIGHGIVDADYHYAYGYNHLDMNSKWGPDATTDPIVNLLSVMDGNPDASRVFLASNPDFDYIEGDSNGNENMTRYLISHRPYFTSGYATSWPDGGDQLGLVIDEVTSTQDARQHEETFTVLDGFLHGYTDALQSHGTVNNWIFDRDDNGQSRWGIEHQALRHRAGDILQEYAGDLAREIYNPTGKAGDANSAPSYTALDSDKNLRLALSPELRDLITDRKKGLFLDLAYDTPMHERRDSEGYYDRVADSALSKISVSAASAMEQELTDAFANNNSAQLTEVTTDYAALLANIEFADEYAHERSGAALDSRNSIVKSSLQFVSAMTPLSAVDGFSDLPEPVKGGANHTRKTAEGLVFSEFLSENNEASARAETGQNVEIITEDIESLMYKSSINGANNVGPQSPEVIEFYNDPDMNPKYDILASDGTFVEWEHMTSDQRTQYENYLKNHDLPGAEMMSDMRRELPQVVRHAFEESSNSED